MNLAIFLPLTLNSFIDLFSSTHLAYVCDVKFTRSDTKSRCVEIKKNKDECITKLLPKILVDSILEHSVFEQKNSNNRINLIQVIHYSEVPNKRGAPITNF